MADRTDKFREMVLYVAKQTEQDPRCGATKLNKILFYSDFTAFRKLGHSISGAEYRKLQYGPVSKPIHHLVEEMEAVKDCAIATRDYGGYPQKRLFALREPRLDLFSAEEIDIIRNVIDDLHELNATEVSDLSHRFIGWRLAEQGEDIAYETVYLGEPRPLSADELAWANEAIDEYLAEEIDA